MDRRARWARVVGTALAASVTLAMFQGYASAGTGGSDRPMKVWATNALHTIGPIDDPGRCPEQPGMLLLFGTFVGGTGHATHVGTYRFEGDHCTYFDTVTQDTWYGFGHWVLTAPDGDRLSAPYLMSMAPAPTDPSVDIVTVASHGFAGGTGRFEDASGHMECTLKLVITDPATFAADMWGSCEGTISYRAGR